MREEILTGRRLRYSIYEDAEKRDPQEYVESNRKTEQEALSIMEPILLLFFGEPDAREIWLELSIITLSNNSYSRSE
jgi:hypothetical protein